MRDKSIDIREKKRNLNALRNVQAYDTICSTDFQLQTGDEQKRRKNLY